MEQVAGELTNQGHCCIIQNSVGFLCVVRCFEYKILFFSFFVNMGGGVMRIFNIENT